ncbi:MAG: T9SS type A sorting domain-containing protein [Flavobacteriales bacterium]|nr:T9SS type A sorting domain-containing protein [Flavobacteriales bacterium]MCB9194352.1 T9SS type A sorting domain-containing protein [Flavobacteriales bacterium]
MRHTLLRPIALTLGLATSIPMLLSQGTVDIGLFSTGDQLEVRVKPHADFDGILSSVVFTLRWDQNTDLDLGDIEQPGDVHVFLPISRSGNVRNSGTYEYQVFAGFGLTPMHDAGTTWTAGKEYTIMTIPYTGSADVQLVNDSWTGELLNNANYYISLGGQDRTGQIYKSAVNATDLDGSVRILPNPNDGHFVFSFVVAEQSDVRVQVMNTLGQDVFSDALKSYQGTYQHEMDLTSMSNGIYYLKITREGTSSVHKIVYR